MQTLEVITEPLLGHTFIALVAPAQTGASNQTGAPGQAGAQNQTGAPDQAVYANVVVVASGFDDLDALCARLSPAVASDSLVPNHDDQHPVRRAVRAYAAGELAALDQVRVVEPRTPFQTQVQQALRAIGPGHPITYTELAAETGRAAAVRAAASACATNLVALIVPCHRVVRTDGGLGGYLFGTELKAALLDHERQHAA